MRALNLFLGFMFAPLVYMSSSAQSSFLRRKINFDEGWKFHLGNAADATKDLNYKIAFNDGTQ